MRLILLFLTMLLSCPQATAQAQDHAEPSSADFEIGAADQRRDITADEAIDVAKWLIYRKNPEQARELLEAMVRDDDGFTPDQENRIEFLIGMIDMNAGDHESAIMHFRRVIASQPDAVRVRLELGRAFYLMDDYGNAQRQFLFARAGDLPENVRRNVDRYLVAIRSLRTMQYSFSLSVARDSNLNAGPSSDTITMYGLPFELSDDAKANSGVGLAIDAGAEFAPRIGKRLKWRFGTQFHRAQYRRVRFDDMTISAYSGPHLTLRKWDFNLLGTYAHRWYGNKPYTGVIGGRFSGTYFVTSRLGIGGAVALNRLRYPRYKPQGGTSRNASLTMFYTPSPSSSLNARATIGRHRAQDPAFANRIRQIRLGITKEMGSGFTITASPTYSRIIYDAALAAFEKRRIDHQLIGQLVILNRKIDLFGVTPRVIFTHTRNDSSVDLYRYRRNRLELGVTRYF